MSTRRVVFALALAASLGLPQPLAAEGETEQAPAAPADDFAAGEQLFNEQLRQLLQLKPGQKRKVLEATIEDQRAGRLEPPTGLKTRSKTFSLKPGAPIQTVYLRPNYPTSIVVQDSTGQPWPITSAVVGNAEWITVQYPAEGTGNVLTIIPNTYEANAGLVMHLEPSVPVNLQLVISSTMTPDQQLTLRADRPGPHAAEPEVVVTQPDTVDRTMVDFLYGIPPAGAQRLTTDNPLVEGWELAGAMYVRAPFQVVWPNYAASTTNGDGETRMFAYKLPRAPQIQLAQDSGKPVFVNIE
jgi:intracellular multiplication protein IcmK